MPPVRILACEGNFQNQARHRLLLAPRTGLRHAGLLFTGLRAQVRPGPSSAH